MIFSSHFLPTGLRDEWKSETVGNHAGTKPAKEPAEPEILRSLRIFRQAEMA